MKKLMSTALASLMAAAFGLGGLTTAGFAQDAGRPQFERPSQPDNANANGRNGGPRRGNGMGQQGQRMGGMPTGLLSLVCSPNGAMHLEIGFVRLSHRVNPTPDQTPLLDALKSSALAAQTKFADSCKAATSAAQPGTPPSMVDRLKTQLAIETARVAALNDVLPKLEGFYNSLTDAQKAALAPRREARNHRPGQQNGPRDVHPGPGTNDGHAQGPTGSTSQNGSGFEG
jgi:hypothetical protein